MDDPQSNDEIHAQIGEQAERVIVGKISPMSRRSMSARLDANSLLVRFGAAVALITGLAAGVAQVLGSTLRNPYEKHEP
jgi:hypothetical protein